MLNMGECWIACGVELEIFRYAIVMDIEWPHRCCTEPGYIRVVLGHGHLDRPFDTQPIFVTILPDPNRSQRSRLTEHVDGSALWWRLPRFVQVCLVPLIERLCSAKDFQGEKTRL